MSRPVRIQRKRTKGFDLQAESLARNGLPCVYVGRPTRFGNPFTHTLRYYGINEVLALYKNLTRGVWNPSLVEHHANPSIPYDDYFEWMQGIGGHPTEVIQAELRGKNLSCFCREGEPCHADILLEMANK